MNSEIPGAGDARASGAPGAVKWGAPEAVGRAAPPEKSGAP